MDGILYKDLMESYKQVYTPQELNEEILDEALPGYPNEQGYNTSSTIETQKADAKRNAARKAEEQRKQAALKAATDKERAAAPAGSSPKQMKAAAIQAMLDKQKARTGNTGGWTKDSLTKAMTPKFDAKAIAKAHKAQGIEPAKLPPENKPPENKTLQTQPAPKPKPQLTPQQKKDKATNAKYDELRKSDPKAAREFGMKASREKFGDQLKPKTPNPLMKGMSKRPSSAYTANNDPDSVSNKPIKSARLSKALNSVTGPGKPAPKPASKAPDAGDAMDGGGSLPKNQAAANKPAPKPTPKLTTNKPNTFMSKGGSSAASSSGGNKFNAKAPKILNNSALSGVKKFKAEEFDTFDLIHEYLLESGFAYDEATQIMVEMGQAKIDEILNTISEEDYDRMKDRRMERGGSGDRRERPMSDGRGKKKGSGDAFDHVVSAMKKQYGDKAIMARKSRKES